MPFESVTLAPRFNLRVEDFGPEHRLYVSCLFCDYQAYFYPAQLRAKFATYTRLKDIVAGFRCPKCKGLDPLWDTQVATRE